jgi:hypothetical protein
MYLLAATPKSDIAAKFAAGVYDRGRTAGRAERIDIKCLPFVSLDHFVGAHNTVGLNSVPSAFECEIVARIIVWRSSQPRPLRSKKRHRA